MNIKALALDLDGTTLMPDNSLGKRTIKVLKELMADGVELVFCTGRAIEAAEPYRAALGAEGPMVFFNGAEVVDMPSGKILEATLLEFDVVDFCIDMSRKMSVHFQIYVSPGIIEGRDKWEALLIDKPTREAEMYSKHTGIIPVVKDLKTLISPPFQGGLASQGGQASQGCIKAMFICEPEWHDEIRAKLSERFGSRIYVARTSPVFLEIMSAGVSKGEGLKTAMKLRGLAKDQVLAAGDEESDITMFDVVGFSAAPLNARENVKAAADYVFASNAEEGLASFLEEKILSGNHHTKAPRHKE